MNFFFEIQDIDLLLLESSKKLDLNKKNSIIKNLHDCSIFLLSGLLFYFLISSLLILHIETFQAPPINVFYLAFQNFQKRINTNFIFFISTNWEKKKKEQSKNTIL